jgi:hypothetical protein
MKSTFVRSLRTCLMIVGVSVARRRLHDGPQLDRRPLWNRST